MSDKALIKTDDVPDLSIEEFGSRRDIAALSNRIRAMMPNGDKLKPAEAMAAAQYALTLGANPFRGEVYAYTDWRGNLQMVEGYKLLVRWAKRQCDYSEWYTPLGDLGDGDVGFTCYILRTDKIDLLQTFLNNEMPYKQAMDIVTTSAGGVVRRKEQYKKKDGSPIDPPTGWTWEDVAKKRALKNALNKSHGVPSLQEIGEASWRVGDTETQPEDWQDVTSDMSPGEAAAEAEYNAKRRATAENPTVASAPEAIGDLFGDEVADEYQEGIVTDPEPVDADPMPADEPEPHKWTIEENDALYLWAQERGLSGVQICEYLNVARISQYPGDLDAAKATIDRQIALEVDAEQMPLVDAQAALEVDAGVSGE
jgi:hypothetical protein